MTLQLGGAQDDLKRNPLLQQQDMDDTQTEPRNAAIKQRPGSPQQNNNNERTK